MTGEFLDLEREIDSFASQSELSMSPVLQGAIRKGKHAGLGEQLALIETKASRSAPEGRRANLMVRIAISVEAFEAIAQTLPLGSVAYETETNEHGQRYIWLDAAMVDRLGAMRGPEETYSDAILRMAGQEALATRRG